jgi:hypothetical protein
VSGGHSIDDLTKLMTPCKDKAHLQAWIRKFLGFTLPDCRVTKYADSTPLDFVWEIYDAIIQGKPLSIMALAGRDASKTVSLSIVDLLSILHDQRHAIHLGMTKKQATRARAYLEKYVYKNPYLKTSLVKENSTEMVLKVGDKEVGLELLPCTPTAVQGGHAALVSWDELASTIAPNIVKGYRDSSGIPGASDKGKPAVTVKITSRQASYSLAEEEVKKAEQGGSVRVVKWTTIDAMERCDDSRSGTTPSPLWINIHKGLKYTEEEFIGVPEADREGFELTTETMDKCLKCPLAVYCQGAARRQTSTSPLLRKIDDVITKITNAGTHQWALSQIMSLQPSSEGLVYFEYDRSTHVPGWNKMWEALTGEAHVGMVTRQMFIDRLKKAGAVFYAGADWGYSNPSTCVVIGVDRRDNIYVVDAIGRTLTNDADWVDIIKRTIHTKYDCQMYCPDSESKSGIDFFRKADLPVVEINKGPGTVKDGINTIKKFLKVPGTNRDTKIYFAPDLFSAIPDVPGILEEMSLYHKETDQTGRILDDKNPVKEHDHYLDALRYVIYWLFGKKTGKFVMAGFEQEAKSTHIPTLEEIARMQGVQYTDNRDQFNQMGKQDTPDPDDDPSGGGAGGAGGLKVAWT